MSEKRKWQKLGSTEIFRDKFFWLTVDDVIMPNGKPSKYGVYHTHGGVFIVARTTDGRYIFVQQERYPIGVETIEVVAGGLTENGDPKEQAANELREEIGASAKDVEILGFVWSSPPRNTTKLYVAIATGVDPADLHHEHQEDNEAINGLMLVAEADVVKLIASGAIQDNGTLASLNLYWSKYGYPKS